MLRLEILICSLWGCNKLQSSFCSDYFQNFLPMLTGAGHSLVSLEGEGCIVFSCMLLVRFLVICFVCCGCLYFSSIYIVYSVFKGLYFEYFDFMYLFCFSVSLNIQTNEYCIHCAIQQRQFIYQSYTYMYVLICTYVYVYYW